MSSTDESSRANPTTSPDPNTDWDKVIAVGLFDSATGEEPEEGPENLLDTPIYSSNDLKPIGYAVFEADSDRIVRLDINHYIAEEVRDRLPGRRIALVYVKSEDLIEETQT